MSKKRTNPDQLPWFKCYQDLWLDGTRDLTPEQRGIYIDCLCLIYKYDQPLRDDVDWVAHKLHVKPRVWKRVRDELVACGKLVQTPDGLTNGRAESEIVERGLVKEMRSKSAKKRPKTSGNDPEKSNENNKTSAANADRVRSKNETVEEEKTESPSTVGESNGLKGDELFFEGTDGVVRLPFAQVTIKRVVEMDVDPVKLIRKYFRKKPEGATDPDAYLMKMAKEQAAKNHGITIAEVEALESSRTKTERAMIAANVVGAFSRPSDGKIQSARKYGSARVDQALENLSGRRFASQKEADLALESELVLIRFKNQPKMKTTSHR